MEIHNRLPQLTTPSGALRHGCCPCGSSIEKILSGGRAKCARGHVFEIVPLDWPVNIPYGVQSVVEDKTPGLPGRDV